MTIVPFHRSLLACLATFVAASLAACAPSSELAGDSPALGDDQRAWKVAFGEVASSDVAAFEVTVVRGSCAGSDVVETSEVPSEGRGVTPTGLAEGSYAIVVRARDGDCRVIGSGCSTFQIPVQSKEVLAIQLEPVRAQFACSAAQCSGGRCSGDGDAPVDAGKLPNPDAGKPTDAGMMDGGAEGGSGGEDASIGPPPAIYDIKRGLVAKGTIVTVSGIVTAVDKNKTTGVVRGMFVQVPETQHRLPDYGYGFSGLYVHTDKTATLVSSAKVGQLVSARGVVEDFFGQTQLNKLEAFEVIASDQTLPPPRVATPLELATGGSLASALEGVLVRVERAPVDTLRPPPTTSDPSLNEFGVGGGLRINDMFYVVSPLPDPGAVMSITGVLRLSHTNSKIEPRDANDIEYHISVKRFSSARVCLPIGVTAGSSRPALSVELTSKAPTGGIAVPLSSDSAYVKVPASVVVPQGTSSVEVPLTAEGTVTGTATVTATLDGASVSALVTLQQGENVTLAALTPNQSTVPYKGNATLTAVLSCPAPAGGIDYAVASDDAAITVGPTLRFEEGEAEKTVQVTSAGGLGGSASISVSKGAEMVSATVSVRTVLLSEIFYDPAGLDDGLEWVEIFNPTDVSIDLAGYTLGYTRSTSLADEQKPLSGSIAPGACLVIGGGPATLLTLISMENANGRSDGVALYDSSAGVVNASRLPVDYVMYGPSDTSKNNIADHEGKILPPDVAAVNSNQSVVRGAMGWSVNLVPTPGVCSAL